MKFKVRDRHVIAGLFLFGCLALALGGRQAELEKERGNSIRRCLEDHSPEECVLLFPPTKCVGEKEVKAEDDD